jgi:hypothetical protein
LRLVSGLIFLAVTTSVYAVAGCGGGIACYADVGTLDCECSAAYKTGNTEVDTCDTSFRGAALCCASEGYPDSAQCECKQWLCQDTSPDVCVCQAYLYENQHPPAGGKVCAPKTESDVCCVGQDVCVCQKGKHQCDDGLTQVNDCAVENVGALCASSDGTTTTDRSVPSCSKPPANLSSEFATTGSGSGTGSGSQNVCPEGPGQCADGDSSTCRCGEICVQSAECAGCAYECVKGCSTDADCTGFYSGDTPPVALHCVSASSTMPTAHCGL